MMRTLPGSLESVSHLVVVTVVVAVGVIGCRDERAVRPPTSGSAVKSEPVGVRRASPPRPLLKVAKDDGSGEFELLELTTLFADLETRQSHQVVTLHHSNSR